MAYKLIPSTFSEAGSSVKHMDTATAAEGLIGQKVIHLQSHKTNSDGTGWWRTKLRDGSEDRKSARYIRKRSYMDNPGSYISWGHQIPVTTELYGDEVTPENSIFYLKI